MTSESDNPLIKALPPATDYLTYLTLLEYQLTPARLPTLHRLLQDEVLTTNIGWDLVQILLPMLPQSQDCLQDVARLGNPREVILRVSDSLMKLEPGDDDESEDESSNQASEAAKIPRHVMQFNCLVAMLSVLHRRIKTKFPSRFIATSLQAALEAYSSMPTNETTNAILEFLRDLSPSKRPTLPPRGTSSSSVVRVSQASAPDPEAAYDEPTAFDDTAMQRKLIQFGLIEVLKTYMLSLSTPDNSGLWLALRLLEKSAQRERPSTDRISRIRMYTEDEQLKERDLIVGRICALSRDIGIKDEDLLDIVLTPAESHPPPIDFEEIPKSAEEIPIERHGALLLLAARSSAATLFEGAETARIPVYPDIGAILSNFVGSDIADQAADEQAQALYDALLALTIISSQKEVEKPADDEQFAALVLALTRCSCRQTYNGLRNIPAAIVHSNPSLESRFNLIHDIIQTDELLYARESAIGWLKDEILMATKTQDENDNIFIDPQYFSKISTSLYNASAFQTLDMSEEIVISWISFSQSLAPYLHAALNLYYVIISSLQLREQFKIENKYASFRKNFLEPLRSICHAFEEDLVQNGGDGHIEAVVGEEMCQVGMAQSVGLLFHIIEQVDEKLGELFGDESVRT
ncbi:YAP1-binding protein 1 [Talaromyces marneffei ATCC 18224]|uniref:YAP-binding/ALF4/Glomulin n=1 Tax=Talaromyces marneffei (strain ATCC 18224 / CBS 334.59 / QM 7333) TaxID=441960 RepID=B6Q2X1_TALMQ|nr:uncharacterized protein EYB26_002325 [Talaromyces marneffei]EEA29069.1 conserved hypothetical protein [Talaromyces marneffei ATCC 18224]KAE8555333.1 hypothetical protein EYB25_000028 [Talaromyces marneffei]QGA14669.1 hypothetical protein EYB26_002325 [Talaromyces marneffei]